MKTQTNPAAEIASFALAIDTAAATYRSGRNNALLAVNARMLVAKLPKGHYLWETLADAYDTLN